MDGLWTVSGRFLDGFCGNLWTGSLGQGPASPKIILFSNVFDNKRDEKGLLGMKGSYITTPRYLMHSVKGQE